jgi:hypothetical protein
MPGNKLYATSLTAITSMPSITAITCMPGNKLYATSLTAITSMPGNKLYAKYLIAITSKFISFFCFAAFCFGLAL